MTFDNLSDADLRIINNLMNSFCNALYNIDFQFLFSQDRDFLENILSKVNYALNSETFNEMKDCDLSCDLLHDKWWAFNPRHVFSLNQDEIKVTLLALDEIFQHFLDVEMDTRIGGTSQEIKILKYKLKDLIVIKDYMLLQWSEFKYYRHIHDYASPLNLRYLIYFFSTEYSPYNDYKVYDKGILTRYYSYFDGNFIYNDLENKMLYIGCAEWEFDKTISVPSIEEFSNYVHEANSCKISHENFIELTDKIIKMKRNPAPFAVMYRDSGDRIHCKGFSFKEELESFPENY